MANLKNITELPLAESAEGLNLIVNDNGAAKQIAASEVGAQADWSVTDENSPAFIKNKPVEEWDLDISVNVFYNADKDCLNHSYTITSVNYNTLKNNIVNGIQPKIKFVWQEQMGPDINAPFSNLIIIPFVFTVPMNFFGDGSPEGVCINAEGNSYSVFLLLTEDRGAFDLTSE